MAFNKYSHLIISDQYVQSKDYTSPSSGGRSKSIPPRNIAQHSRYLKDRLTASWRETENKYSAFHINRNGIYLEFKSYPGVELVIKSLEDMRSKKIRLLNVREKDEQVEDEQTGETTTEKVIYATVYISNDKKGYFLKKIEEYATKVRTNQKGETTPYNAPLINSIAEIKEAFYVTAFWQDKTELIPIDEKDWCEVWLSSDTIEEINNFEQLLNSQQISHRNGHLVFPERSVKVILANKDDLENIAMYSDNIAEFRMAKTPASFWINLPNREQTEWVKDLLERIKISFKNTSICILDSGVNHGHPLLKPICKEEDCQAVISAWESHDSQRHGTLMAGLATYGDLGKSLESSENIEIKHCIESVKILPNPPEENPKDLYGKRTVDGISLAEIQNPTNKRILCMAVTSDDDLDRGRPSSWSGEIDTITSGANDENKRLMIVSAGNINNARDWKEYTSAQETSSIQDPAQAWNCITVGAFTSLNTITEPDYSEYIPIAPKDGISPFSTTSSLWDDKHCPIKPEIVMEGGNAGVNSAGFPTEIPDLSILTTNDDFVNTGQFTYFGMTSAATAKAAWLAAQIQTEYPDYWPETVRALIIHSAEWTDKMKEQFLDNEAKKSYKNLLRRCGYGVPNIDRAVYSASNSLTLISQRSIQPFHKIDGKYKTKEMHLYELPWPKEVLQELPPATKVSMRVTLSYFIEPGPGQIGWDNKYRYSSFGLKFDINSPGESSEEFTRRINQAVRDEENGHPGTDSASDYWTIGEQGRDKGSIHSDTWNGSAAELAASNIVAVYPRIGWWKERHYLNKYDNSTRYSLIVSITTEEEDIDIYTPVAVKVNVPVSVQIET